MELKVSIFNLGVVIRQANHGIKLRVREQKGHDG